MSRDFCFLSTYSSSIKLRGIQISFYRLYDFLLAYIGSTLILYIHIVNSIKVFNVRLVFLYKKTIWQESRTMHDLILRLIITTKYYNKIIINNTKIQLKIWMKKWKQFENVDDSAIFCQWMIWIRKRKLSGKEQLIYKIFIVKNI